MVSEVLLSGKNVSVPEIRNIYGSDEDGKTFSDENGKSKGLKLPLVTIPKSSVTDTYFPTYSSFLSFDWLFFKLIFNFGRSVVVDTFQNNSDIETLSTNVKFSELPWCDGLEISDKNERCQWDEVLANLSTFYLMSKEVRKDISRGALGKWIPLAFITCLSYVMPFQILLSSTGRERWSRVAKTYFSYLLMCLGIFNKEMASKIVENFHDFKSLTDDSSNFEETIFNNDDTVAFVQFVSSFTTCRITLWQFVPSLTLVSIMASAVASSPLYLPRNEMNIRLPPFFFFNAFTRAKKILNATSFFQGQVCFFGYYMLINHSRLIQFIINGFISLVSIAIIFSPNYLRLLVPPLMFILLHQGLLSAIFVVLQLFIQPSDDVITVFRPAYVHFPNLDDESTGKQIEVNIWITCNIWQYFYILISF